MFSVKFLPPKSRIFNYMAKKKAKKNGRPTKYKKEFCKQLIEFFDIEPYEITTEKFYYKNGDVKEKEVQVASPLPFFSAFARKIGVCVDTLNEWTKRHKDFSEAYKTAKEIQREILITNGLKGLYNATSYIFTAKNITDMRDHQEQVIGITGELQEFIEQLNGKINNPPSEDKDD